MAKLTFEQQIKRMTREQLEEHRTEIEAYRDKIISEISAPGHWSVQAQDGHRQAYIRKAIIIEGILNGEDAVEELKSKLYGQQYRKKTPEQKAEALAVVTINGMKNENKFFNIRKRKQMSFGVLSSKLRDGYDS